MTGISTVGNYTLITGHTAKLPASTANYFSNEANLNVWKVCSLAYIMLTGANSVS